MVAKFFFPSITMASNLVNILSCSELIPTLLISFTRKSAYSSYSILLAELCEFYLSAKEDYGSLAL